MAILPRFQVIIIAHHVGNEPDPEAGSSSGFVRHTIAFPDGMAKYLRFTSWGRDSVSISVH